MADVLPVPSQEDITKLFSAIRSDNDEDAINLVMRYGRNIINTTASEDRTPLIVAVRRFRMQLVPFLLDAGADINVRDNGGATALAHIAGNLKSAGAMEIMQVLLERCADINVQDRDGMTPLMRSLGNVKDNCDGIALLLKHGADLDIKNCNGDTAEMLVSLFDGPGSLAGMLRECRQQRLQEAAQKAQEQAEENAVSRAQVAIDKAKVYSVKLSLKKRRPCNG